jgi:hypothetical protein
MARGSLPEQTPSVPAELFFAFNDLYLFVKRMSSDLAIIEGPGGPGGGAGGHKIQDEGVDLPQQAILNFTGSGVQVVDTGTKTAVVVNSANSYFPSGW